MFGGSKHNDNWCFTGFWHAVCFWCDPLMGGSMQHDLFQVWPTNGLDTNADWHGRNKCCSVFKDKTTSSHVENQTCTRGRVCTSRHIQTWLARQDILVESGLSSVNLYWVSPELACQAAIHIFYSFYWSVEGKLGSISGQLSVYGICPEVAAFVNINMTYPPIHSIYNLSPPSIPKSGWFWLGLHPSLAGPTPHCIIFHWLSSGHLSLHAYNCRYEILEF